MLLGALNITNSMNKSGTQVLTIHREIYICIDKHSIQHVHTPVPRGFGCRPVQTQEYVQILSNTTVDMLSFSLCPPLSLCVNGVLLSVPPSLCVNVVLLSVPLCPSVWMLSFSLSPSVWMSSFSLISVWMLFFSLPLCGNIVLVAAPLCECCPSLCPSVLMLFLSLSVLLCPYVWMLSFSLSLCVNVVLVLYIIFIKSIQSPDCHGSPHILGLVLD